MKYYKSYMDRQEISQETQKNLLNLRAERGVSGRPWVKYGALAACAALILGVGAWKLAPRPHTPSAPHQAAVDSASVSTCHPLQADNSQGATDAGGFVVSSPAESGKLAFPMVPAITYTERGQRSEVMADRALVPGSFMVNLTKEDIQSIFWGPEGRPEASHPKLVQGDLPWTLFWDGYTVHGYAWYDGQGQLTELTIYGEQDRANFELELRPGALPFTCCMDVDRGDEVSEFNGVEVAGWSKVYDQDGDGQTDDICGSEFMTKNNIGVRFTNQNSTMRAEYGGGGDMDLGGACTFNALFVRQALAGGGGLYLDHLMTNENIPAWRDETFSTLAQARQEAEFAPYLPAAEPEGYGSYSGNKEFFGRLSYQEGKQNMLFVRWSRGYDDMEVCVHKDGYYPYNLVDPDNPAGYDVRLYSIPWCDSVPQEYRETVNLPAFKAEDMSLSIVEARGVEKDTGGLSFDFDVLHSDGTVVSYRCDGLTAREVWEMVAETL